MLSLRQETCSLPRGPPDATAQGHLPPRRRSGGLAAHGEGATNGQDRPGTVRPMFGITILMLVFAAGIGVCAFTDALEGIWLVAVAAAVIVALAAAFYTLPAPPSTSAEDFRFRFIMTALI